MKSYVMHSVTLITFCAVFLAVNYWTFYCWMTKGVCQWEWPKSISSLRSRIQCDRRAAAKTAVVPKAYLNAHLLDANKVNLTRISGLSPKDECRASCCQTSLFAYAIKSVTSIDSTCTGRRSLYCFMSKKLWILLKANFTNSFSAKCHWASSAL